MPKDTHNTTRDWSEPVRQLVCSCAKQVRTQGGNINDLRRVVSARCKKAGVTLWQLDYELGTRSFVVMTSTANVQYIHDPDWKPDPWR